MTLPGGVGHVQKCKQHYKIRVNYRTRQDDEQHGGRGGMSNLSHEVGHAVFHMSRKHTHINMRSCSLQQRAAVFCKTFRSSAPSLHVQDIPLNLAETCLKTDPCFHSVLREKGEGRTVREHGETKTWARRAAFQWVRGQTERLIIYMLSTAVSQMKGPLVNFMAALKEQEHTKSTLCSTEPLGVEHTAHVTPWRLSLIRQHFQVTLEGRTDRKFYQGQTAKLWL